MQCDRSHRFLKRRFVTAQVNLWKAECVIGSEFELESWTAMKASPWTPRSIQSPVWLPVNLPSLSPTLPASESSPLHLLDAFAQRIKQGVLWFSLGELCRGLRSCNPPSTAAWDTKRACVPCQGTWWHFWASESLWISALESGFLEAASQTGPASGTLSHARSSICRCSIRPLWGGPCSEMAQIFKGLYFLPCLIQDDWDDLKDSRFSNQDNW